MNIKLSISPDRGTFQIKSHIKNQLEKGEKIENDELLEYYYEQNLERRLNESNSKWAENNLEHDLRSTDWILQKVRNNKSYAQNLYAALCNNDFQKNAVWPILKDQIWTCSWRYAGGVVADMRQEGDYIDWYCSGIRGDLPAVKIDQLSEEQKKEYNEVLNYYVSEGTVTQEIAEDLFKLGWDIVTD